MNLSTIDEVVTAKENAPEGAFLQCLQGHCTLWDKIPHTGHRAKLLGHWLLSEPEVRRLAQIGIFDRRC